MDTTENPAVLIPPLGIPDGSNHQFPESDIKAVTSKSLTPKSSILPLGEVKIGAWIEYSLGLHNASLKNAARLSAAVRNVSGEVEVTSRSFIVPAADHVVLVLTWLVEDESCLHKVIEVSTMPASDPKNIVLIFHIVGEVLKSSKDLQLRRTADKVDTKPPFAIAAQPLPSAARVLGSGIPKCPVGPVRAHVDSREGRASRIPKLSANIGASKNKMKAIAGKPTNNIKYSDHMPCDALDDGVVEAGPVEDGDPAVLEVATRMGSPQVFFDDEDVAHT